MGPDELLERIEGWCTSEGLSTERFENDTVAWGLHLKYPQGNPKRLDVVHPKEREGVIVISTGLMVAQKQRTILASMDEKERRELTWELYMFILERGFFSAFQREEGVLSRLTLQKEVFYEELSRPAFLAGLRDAYMTLMWLVSAIQRACGTPRASSSSERIDEELPMFR